MNIYYLTGSCFMALGIYLGLRSIARAILKKKIYVEHVFLGHRIVISKSRNGDEFTVRIF
jgi:hypothetical protein